MEIVTVKNKKYELLDGEEIVAGDTVYIESCEQQWIGVVHETRIDLEHGHVLILQVGGYVYAREAVKAVEIAASTNPLLTVTVVYPNDMADKVDHELDWLKKHNYVSNWFTRPKKDQPDCTRYVIEFASAEGAFMFGGVMQQKKI